MLTEPLVTQLLGRVFRHPRSLDNRGRERVDDNLFAAIISRFLRAGVHDRGRGGGAVLVDLVLGDKLGIAVELVEDIEIKLAVVLSQTRAAGS